MASFFSRAGSQYVVKELTHIWPFVTGFGIMTVAMHSIPTPKEQRAQSDYAKQIDHFWDREKYQALFSHGHGDHGHGGDAAHGDAHGHGAHGHGDNSRVAEVTSYIK